MRRPIWGRRRASVAENGCMPSRGRASAKQKRDARPVSRRRRGSADGLYSDPDFLPDASSLWLDGQAPGEALQQAGVGADLVAGWARPSPSPRPTAWRRRRRAASLPHRVGRAGRRRRPSSTIGSSRRATSSAATSRSRARLRRHDARGQGLLRRPLLRRRPRLRRRLGRRARRRPLPVGADGAPCFGRCPTARGRVPIIEKAFAKYKGCYEATSGGSVEDGLLYLTGEDGAR